MAKIEVNTLNNANVYIDGNSLLGRVEEIKLPVVKIKMIEHKACGIVGAIKLSSGGLEPFDGDVKWNAFYADVWAKILNPFSPVQMQVRGSLETHTSQGRVAQVPYIVYLTATFDEVPMGDLKQNDKAAFDSKYYSSYIKQQVNGQEVLEIDVLANIYKVNGVDLLDQYRSNIGG